MSQIEFAVYVPSEKGLPFLAVRIDGTKTRYKKITATAAKTRAAAEVILEDLKRDLLEPHWRERAELKAHYGSSGRQEEK